MAGIGIGECGRWDSPLERLSINTAQAFNFGGEARRIIFVGDGHQNLSLGEQPTPVRNRHTQSVLTLGFKIQRSLAQETVSLDFERSIVGNPSDQSVLK